MVRRARRNHWNQGGGRERLGYHPSDLTTDTGDA
jgi:hypothetical protein